MARAAGERLADRLLGHSGAEEQRERRARRLIDRSPVAEDRVEGRGRADRALGKAARAWTTAAACRVPNPSTSASMSEPRWGSGRRERPSSGSAVRRSRRAAQRRSPSRGSGPPHTASAGCVPRAARRRPSLDHGGVVASSSDRGGVASVRTTVGADAVTRPIGWCVAVLGRAEAGGAPGSIRWIADGWDRQCVHLLGW